MICRLWKSTPRFLAARSVNLSVHVVAVLVFAVCYGSLPGSSTEAAEESAEASQPLEYRRIFAPADQIDRLLGRERYLPIEAAEFARLISQASEDTYPAPSTFRPYLERASYEARLVGDQLVDGKAKLTIVHRAGHSSLLPLAPCSLAISRPFWQHDPSAPAVLGLSDSVRIGVVVEPFLQGQSDTLQFGWSLRGVRESSDVLTFDLQLPASPTKQLTLALRETLVPRFDVGLITNSQLGDAGWRTWQIELGGHDRLVFRVVPRATAPEQQPPALVRQLLTYDLSPRGLEVAAQFTLDAPTQAAAVDPLRRIRVSMDPALQLIAAHFGEAALPWSISTDAVTGRTQVLLELAEPLQGTGRVLHLTAVAKIVTDRLWRLPDIRPEGMFWVEGTARLFVPDAFVLEQLRAVDCRQTKTEPLPAPRLGEAIELQYFSPTAAPEIHITHRTAQLSMQTATTLQFTTDEVSGRLVADCEVSGPAMFLLQARVSPEWVIDSVTSIPAGAIGEWDLSPAAEGPQRLTIPLTRALASGAPLRLVILGRTRRSALASELALGDLHLLRFEQAKVVRPIVLVHTTDPFRLEVAGDERLTRLDRAELDPDTSNLFNQPLPSDGLLFVHDRQAERLRFSLHRQSPRYTSQIHVEATVTGDTLVETHRIACVPESARIERVLVHFLLRSESDLRWTVEPAGEQQPSARRLTADEQQAAGLGPGGETWEVTLHRSQSEPFELQAVRTSPFAGERAVNLASLPEATEQRGRVTIRSMGRQVPEVINRRLEPIPIEPLPPGQFSAVRAVLRYEPARDTTPTAEPPLVLVPWTDETAVRPLAWVWHLDVRSKTTPGGTTEHYAALRIQNSGLLRIELTMPEGARLLAVWVDDHEVLQEMVPSSSDALSVELPLGRKFPVITVHYLTDDAPLGMFTRIGPRWPRVDLPVVAGQWTLWVPPGYEAPGAPESQARWHRSWSQRLFGPLGRPRRSHVFNPFRADDWTGLGRWAMFDHERQLSDPLARESAHDAPLRESDLPSLPWKSTGPIVADTTGWSVYRTRDMTAVPGTIRVVRVRVVRMLSVLVFLLTTALGCWQLTGRPVAMVTVLGLSGVAALVVPLAYVSLATGLFLGLLASLAVRLIFRQPESSTATQDTREASSSNIALTVSFPGTGQTIIFMVVLLGSAAAAWHASAEEPVAEPVAVGQPDSSFTTDIHKIFIPTGADRKPTGNRYYVAEAFYRQLHRRIAAAQQRPGAWVITRAIYRGDLKRIAQSARPPGRTPGPMRVSRLQAVFDLHVLTRNAKVRIPIERTDAEWLVDEARLDGRAIAWHWEAKESALVIEIEEPGRYRFELPVQPALHVDEEMVGFELAIPAVADSRLELTLRADAPPITFPTARGAITPGARQGLVVAELGATDRLAARWPRGTDDATEAQTEVEELLWMHIGPGRVMLNAKFKVQVLEGQVSELRLLADARLRLLPFGEDSPVESYRIVPGDPQTILLELGGSPQEVTIDARLLLTGTSGIGSLRLPRLEMQATHTSRRLLAVSIDPALQYDEDAEQQLESLAVSDFVAAWGAVEVEPSFAHQLPVANPTWSVATQPLQTDTIVEQTLVLNLRREEAEVLFDADITIEVGYEFQHHLSAPKDLMVESISVRGEDGVERAARWSRDREGAITIFLTGPVVGPSHLQLRGTLPTGPTGRFPLPRVDVERSEIEENQIHVYRQPTVLVRVENATGLEPLERLAPAPQSPEQGRLVGQFAVENNPAMAVLVVSPNEPNVSGVAVTSLHREEDGWEATLDYHFHTEQGVVDAVRLDAPSWWGGPYQVEPPATVTTVEIPGERRRQVIVRPHEAISGEYRLRIRAPLVLAENQRPRIPDIVPLVVDRLERFLVLPIGADDQRMTWETRGVQPAELPEGFGRPLDEREVWQAYRVVGQSPQAQLTSVRKEFAAPQIRLADVRMAYADDGTFRGVATFDLEAAGLRDCELRLPDGYRLVQATVAGLPSWPQVIDNGRWRLSLGPYHLPQRIEIVFVREVGRSIWSWSEDELHAPRLLAGGREIDVERTLWTVYSPASLGDAAPIGIQPTSILRQELARLRTIASMVDLDANVVTEQGSGEIAEWYRPWAQRFLRTSRAVQRHATGVGRGGEAQTDVEATLAEQLGVAQRLGTTSVLAELSSAAPYPAEPAELWHQGLGQKVAATRAMSQGKLVRLRLRYENPQGIDLLWRLTASLLLALAAGALVVAIRRGTSCDLLARWPHALGVAGGLFWWLFLSPSAGGWVVMAFTLGMLFRRNQ